MIRDTDHGAKALLKKVRRAGSVKVGVMGSEAGEKHGDLTVADIATFHEFGLGNPKRSFIADYVDEGVSDIEAKIRSAAERVIRGSTIERELSILGLYIQGEIQKRMSAGIPPPLKPATIARKGSSTPLIDTGQLRSSITYEVEKVRSRG